MGRWKAPSVKFGIELFLAKISKKGIFFNFIFFFLATMNKRPYTTGKLNKLFTFITMEFITMFYISSVFVLRIIKLK